MTDNISGKVAIVEHFDTAYAYSTLHGREFYLGLKWEFGGRE